MDHLLQDVRFAARTLLKRPAFTVAVVLTLGLGIAANTAIFSVANAVLLDPLPFEQADRLVTPNPISYRGFGISLSIPNYYDWKERASSWDSFGAYRGVNAVLTGLDRPDVVRMRQVLGDFFAALRVSAQHGRLITAEESEPGAEPIAVISDSFWRNRLGASDDTVGSAITLDGVPFTVVGILPAGFEFPSPNDAVFVPLGLFADDLAWESRGSSSGTRAIARLADSVTLEQAQADLDRVITRIRSEEDENAATAELVTVAELYVGDVRTPVLIMMGAVGLVLLIACANVANLLLVRSEGRQREIAVRTALGAGRGRVLRQLLTESLLLGLAGGVAGAGLAAVAIRAMSGSLPDEIPALVAGRVGMDATVFTFTAGVSLLAGVLFGLAPAVRSLRPEVVATLKEGARGTSGGRRRLSSGLVVAEIGLSLMLLAGAGLLVKSLDELHRVDVGFDPTNVLTARIPLPDAKYDTEAEWRGFFNEIIERVAALPGVEHASVSQTFPLSGNSWETSISPEGVDPYDAEQRDSVQYYIAGIDHFDVLGIDIVRGRAFDERDVVGAQPVVIIDETMAEKYWPGEDPLGKRITMEWKQPDGAAEDADEVPVYRTVVGVTRHVRHYQIEEAGRIQAYLPFRQTPNWWGFSGYLMIRTATDPASIAGLVRAEVESMDPDQPMTLVRTLDEVVASRLSTYGAMRGLLVMFSALALLLAAVGIYGVMAYSVTERAREIGIRMALGAERRKVLGMVCGQGLKLTVAGLVVGLAGALLATRWLQGMLYGIGASEPRTLGVVAVILASAAMAAAYLPARRATRVDPATVLRDE